MNQKRPIDKSIINVLKQGTSAQQSTDLVVATYPCTVTGLRWQLSAATDASNNCSFSWAIVLLKDGNSANAIASSDGSTFYEPEQNVLAFGYCDCLDKDAAAGPGIHNFDGTTKTMRKLMGGDKIVMLVKMSTSAGSFAGPIQFFCKT